MFCMGHFRLERFFEACLPQDKGRGLSFVPYHSLSASNLLSTISSPCIVGDEDEIAS